MSSTLEYSFPFGSVIEVVEACRGQRTEGEGHASVVGLSGDLLLMEIFTTVDTFLVCIIMFAFVIVKLGYIE